ncbi:uncharacterized protein I303_104373 [Kwoniella dejecticola CBS 10117]|uniref:Uncharacterized protein n=1 Tax=Kwoniella dejecticola CBS 10117 TaxID=1296121 RepID=A0A1A6A5I8_9TREE|nr:uncharacterized protein I303_04650 [Kwoniella dejecticola CBS 10117]OBR85315.1 hypothetical protein I303_04650 [Kwoniella dejecticola CBS 10117]
MRSTFITSFFLIFTLLTSALAKYVDWVIDSEKDSAAQVDSFAIDHHDEVYHFIAKTHDGKIIVQIRYEDDSVGIEAFFTETESLNEHLSIVQKIIFDATSSAGLENYSDGAASLETLQAYRYGAPDEGGELDKRLICRPCRECLRDVNEHLQKKASRCGQFCSVGANCITPGCTACYYTGGECRWQKSCQYNW